MIGLILAGGSGSRLWPLSRELYPKQLLSLGDELSLIQRTVKRLLPSIPAAKIHVVTSHQHRDGILNQLSMIDKALASNLIIEPMGKNTAPAILLSALYLSAKFGPDEVVAVMPADHVIGDEAAFNSFLERAERTAAAGKIVTFGVIPDSPATGFGYIKGGQTQLAEGVFPVERFCEKPDLKTAEGFLASGDYYWNAGMFFFKISTMLSEAQKLLPDMYGKLCGINPADLSEVTDAYNAIENISIDYGIMEKSRLIVVIPVEFKWNDIGDFDAIHELSADKDEHGNVAVGKIAQLDCKNSLLLSSGRLIGGIGLDGMIVVDSEDATLVCPRNRSQDVKLLCQLLKARGDVESIMHRTIYRPWGYSTTLFENPGFVLKRIVVYPGKRLSLQRHYHRSEHWVVVGGSAKVTKGSEEFLLSPNESVYIPATSFHRMENPGKIDLQIIEVQVGDYLKEDDIERIEDDYGR
ncbi:MAG: mannose-1-phosphate guanylyltransferase/mannose-6-phosphate isomerase [Candidatus Wallbacteria bacterium]|nr:mannose-1-phosphate guanylyltransferase/mannose-6-phosphate isomerase [Candidatus Wallbacteria bacterium]